jgi:hypothetical protein
MSDATSLHPADLPGVDSANVDVGGQANVMPDLPQTFPQPGIDGDSYIGQGEAPPEQGVDVLPPFAGPTGLWPAGGSEPTSAGQGQAVGPWVGTHPTATQGVASANPTGGSVAESVSLAASTQAAIMGDILDVGTAMGDQIDIPMDGPQPDAYTPNKSSDIGQNTTPWDQGD